MNKGKIINFLESEKKNQNPFFLTLFSFIKVTKKIMGGSHDALNICGAPKLSTDFTTYTMGKIF